MRRQIGRMLKTGIAEPLRRRINRALNVDLIRLDRIDDVKSHLARVFAAHRIDTVIDAGANEGQFGALLRRLGYAGAIHSFEPVQSSYRKLTAQAQGDRAWSAHNSALGAEPGTALMNVSGNSVFSSMLAPNNFGLAEFSDMKTDRQEQVAVDTVANFLANKIDPAARVFLKMDTQGYDLHVFAGAKPALGQIFGLMSELSMAQIYQDMSDYAAALATYQAGGFAISGIYPVTRRADLSVIEMDCILVKSAA